MSRGEIGQYLGGAPDDERVPSLMDHDPGKPEDHAGAPVDDGWEDNDGELDPGPVPGESA